MSAARGLVALCACILLLTGCNNGSSPATGDVAPRDSLVIGLIPEKGVFRQLERYEPLARYLSRQTGTDINLRVLPRYRSVVDDFEAAGLDGAFFGSLTYVLAQQRVGLELLARPVGQDDTSTYHGMMLVRRDSGIHTIEDMRGKRFVFVDVATTAGYLFPLHFFRKHGLPDYRNFFSESYFAGTHEDAILDIVEGRADVGAAKNTAYSRLAERDSRVADELMVLETSPEVPENALALSSGVDENIRRRMQEVLLTMHETPGGRRVLEQFGAQRFIETTDDDYTPVYEYAGDLGLEIVSGGVGAPR